MKNTELVMEGAAEGMVLWSRTVIPALYPFIFISSFLAESETVYFISDTLGNKISRILHITPISIVVLLNGFLFGCPAGAKCMKDLYEQNRISFDEGGYLLSFCNNTSPFFLISYLIVSNLKRRDLIIPSLIIFYSGILISCFLFWVFIYRGIKPGAVRTPERIKKRNIYENIDRGINSGCSILVKLGGYLIIFTVLRTMLIRIPVDHFIWNYILLPSVEMIGGIHMLCESGLPFGMKYTLCMGLCSFGGICCAFQTGSVIGQSEWSLNLYIKEKLVTSMITSLIAFLFICITE